mgnify:CR=1 FL=1
MSNFNSINNSGVPYYFPADIAKEGQQYTRFSNWLKTRVNDNGKKVPVKWYDQGRVMNVNGLTPFIQGMVGHFTTDENDELMPSSDVVSRDWQGSPADVTDGGLAFYTLEDQFFCQAGLFKGVFGLRDNSGNVYTSVNIVFEILGNDLRIGETTKYYSSELEKMKSKFANDTRQAIKQFQDKYDQEVSAHSNALTDDTVALRNLATTAGSIKSELEAKNYVEYADFTKSNDAMRNAIDDRLQHISLVPETFASLDDLKAKYPDGKDGLFRVGQEGYIWRNGNWTGIGALSTTTVSDADYTQRTGSFMFFSAPNDRVEIAEKHNVEINEYTGTISIPSGVLIYVNDDGKFKNTSTLKLDYSYNQQDVDANGMLTLYFDNNSKLYMSYKPERRNDVKLFSIYQGKIYGGINFDHIYINGIAEGGWGQKNKIAKAMPYTGDEKIYITVSDFNYQVDIPKTVNFIDDGGQHWPYLNGTQHLEYQGNGTTVISLFLNKDSSSFYLDTKAHQSDDFFVASLYNAHAYGSSSDDIVVNGIDNGGFGSNSVNGYSMLLPMYEDDNHISVEFDQSDWKYNISYPEINVIETNGGKHYVSKAGTATGQGDGSTTLNVYFDVETQNLYIDTLGHRSTDVMIATLYSAYAYGQDVRAFVVNGIDNGGFGQVYKPYTLTDWRIDAYAGQEVNIVWLGDSTFEGFKVKNSENIAANYINKLLINNFPKVRSYNCSKGGWTTWQLNNDFEKFTKNVPNIKLVLIGGGINDCGNIAKSEEALKEIVAKVQKAHAVPIICTSQASAMLFSDQSVGGDWDGMMQSRAAKINEMRRIFAKNNDLPLIDMEKFDTNFVEYSNYKLGDMFDDQLHGHDVIHQFEAELVMAFLSKDHLDFINQDKNITITTQKAVSASSYNLTNQELDDAKLNSKGFKGHMSRSGVNSDLTIIDYQFFIPAGAKKYYLNGYNLGDPVSVIINGQSNTLSTTSQITTLDAGYYHVVVKPTTEKFDFVGLRIEEDQL